MFAKKKSPLFPSFAVTYEGDPETGSKYLGRARSMLSLMCRSIPPVKCRRDVIDGVEIRVTTNPNHIYIGGGRVYITYTDVMSPVTEEQSHRDRFVHISSKLITEEPPPSTPPNRDMPLPRFNPSVKQAFYAGKGYWISKDNSLCVSWRNREIFIRGKHYQLDGLLSDNILCACLIGKELVAIVTFNSASLTVFVINLIANTINYSRVFYTASPINLNAVSNHSFLTDKKTLIIHHDNGDIEKILFSGDNSNSLYGKNKNTVIYSCKNNITTGLYTQTTITQPSNNSIVTSHPDADTTVTKHYFNGGNSNGSSTINFTTPADASIKYLFISKDDISGISCSPRVELDTKKYSFSRNTSYPLGYASMETQNNNPQHGFYQTRSASILDETYLSREKFVDDLGVVDVSHDGVITNRIVTIDGKGNEFEDIRSFHESQESGYYLGQGTDNQAPPVVTGSYFRGGARSFFSKSTSINVLFCNYNSKVLIYGAFEDIYDQNYSFASGQPDPVKRSSHIWRYTVTVLCNGNKFIAYSHEADSFPQPSEYYRPTQKPDETSNIFLQTFGCFAYKNYSFDGVMLVLCWEYNPSRDHAEKRTLILNVKTGEYQVLDYRVDSDWAETYPLSVTSI